MRLFWHGGSLSVDIAPRQRPLGGPPIRLRGLLLRRLTIHNHHLARIEVCALGGGLLGLRLTLAAPACSPHHIGVLQPDHQDSNAKPFYSGISSWRSAITIVTTKVANPIQQALTMRTSSAQTCGFCKELGLDTASGQLPQVVKDIARHTSVLLGPIGIH
eukprot:1822093-Amphidinium_carterae.1